MSRQRLVAIRTILGALGLFSGVALLLHIVAALDLRVGLAITALGTLVAVSAVLSRAAPEHRRWMLLTIGIGVAAGFLATIAYDVSRALLSTADPSPFNPFEAIRRFGQLILGDGAGEQPTLIAGMLFHVLNGSMFGVAFTFLFARDGATTRRRAILTGIGWGLFLELFQIGLYPGWLQISAYREFLTISALGHVVYGATLGGTSRTMLRGAWPRREGDDG